jgi:hypothetical protein
MPGGPSSCSGYQACKTVRIATQARAWFSRPVGDDGWSCRISGIDSVSLVARRSRSREAAVGESEVEEWEIREEGTNRVLGTSSFAKRPVRGDVVELDGERFDVRQVANIAVGDTQRGWLIVSS